MGHDCGAVTAAYMVLGLSHGPKEGKVFPKIEAFNKEFKARHRELGCSQLLGVDMGTKEGVKEADKIVVIPPAISTFEKGNVDSITIGRGNFSEMKTYEKHMQECEQEPVMSLFKDNREYKIIKYAETAERNWQTNFAKLFVIAI